MSKKIRSISLYWILVSLGGFFSCSLYAADQSDATTVQEEVASAKVAERAQVLAARAARKQEKRISGLV